MNEVEDRAAPKAAAQFHSYREIPSDPAGAQQLWSEMVDLQERNGATFWRFTIVSPDYPRRLCSLQTQSCGG